jgi:hypothetical protein
VGEAAKKGPAPPKRDVGRLDHHVALQIEREGERVQVVAADDREPPVEDGGLRVQDSACVGVHLDARGEEAPDNRLHRQRRDPDVGALRHENADAHAAPRRRTQRVEEERPGEEIGARDVDRLMGMP